MDSNRCRAQWMLIWFCRFNFFKVVRRPKATHDLLVPRRRAWQHTRVNCMKCVHDWWNGCERLLLVTARSVERGAVAMVGVDGGWMAWKTSRTDGSGGGGSAKREPDWTRVRRRYRRAGGRWEILRSSATLYARAEGLKLMNNINPHRNRYLYASWDFPCRVQRLLAASRRPPAPVSSIYGRHPLKAINLFSTGLINVYVCECVWEKERECARASLQGLLVMQGHCEGMYALVHRSCDSSNLNFGNQRIWWTFDEHDGFKKKKNTFVSWTLRWAWLQLFTTKNKFLLYEMNANNNLNRIKYYDNVQL